MKATSPELEALLRHYSGHEAITINSVFLRRNWTSYGGDSDPGTSLLWGLSESFGKKEFEAGICFIDMTGFSERARGKPPREVSAIVSPFLRTVITTATESKCFVDKTIGDEVMVVMPVFPRMGVGDPLNDMAWFIFEVVRRMETAVPDIQFRAGIAFGKVFLDEIETDSYHEWSVFGNCVNGAKRLQAIPPRLDQGQLSMPYRAIIGAVDSEYPNFLRDFGSFEAGLQNPDRCFQVPPPLEFLNARKDCEELKGVGRMCFHDAFVRQKKATRVG